MFLSRLLLLALIVVVAWAFWRVVDGIMVGLTGRGPRAPQRGGVQMARDPICGTFVLPDQALALGDGSRRVFFCSARCRDKYRARSA